MVSGVLLPLFLRTVFSASTTAATFCASVFLSVGSLPVSLLPGVSGASGASGAEGPEGPQAAKSSSAIAAARAAAVHRFQSFICGPPLSSYGSALLPGFILSPAAARCQWADAPNFAGKFRQSVQKQEHFKIASACAPAIFSGKIIFYSQFRKICRFPGIAFSPGTLRELFCTQKGCRTACVRQPGVYQVMLGVVGV